MEEKKLIRFLNGCSCLEERREISIWLDQPGSDLEAEKIILQNWNINTFNSPVDGVDYSRILDKIHSVISPEHGNIKSEKSMTIWKMGRWAASFLLILFSGFFLIQTLTPIFQKPPTKEITFKKFVKSTNAGEKLKIILPDKSTVVLNSLSKLSFDSDFGKKERVVHLEGEGYFTIVSNPEKPFKVLSGGVVTTALGTSFNTYSRSGEIVISLVEGKVSVSQKMGEVVLDPGIQANISPDKDVGLQTKKFDPEKTTAWKEGKIKFESRTLKEVLDKLENWYGVTFRVDEGVDKYRKVTGHFNNESLDNLLQGLSFSLDLKFMKKGNQVILQSKRPME